MRYVVGLVLIATSSGCFGISSGPPAPVVSRVSPASPSGTDPNVTFGFSNLPPVVGSKLAVYADGNCGQVAVTGTNPDGTSSTTLQLKMQMAGKLTISAKSYDTSGKASDCSNSASYTYGIAAGTPSDPTPSTTATPPATPGSATLTAPVLSLVNPSTSPSTSSSVQLSATGLVNSNHLYLYTQAGCGGSPIGWGGTDGYTYASMYVSSLSPGTYHFSAKYITTDSQTSPCSSAALDYTVLQTPAPTGLALISPASASSTVPTPTIAVAGVPSGDFVYLYTDVACTHSVGSAYSSGTSVNITTTTLAVGSYTFYAKVADYSNPSPCSTSSVGYTVLAPLAPTSVTLTSPATSPSVAPSISVSVGGVNPGLTISLYTDSACTTKLGSSVTAIGTSATLSATFSTPGSYTIYAQAANGATTSACSTASASYQLMPPTAPSSLTLISPTGSPSTSTSAVIQAGGVASGELISLYDDSQCLEYLMGSATAGASTVNVNLTGIPIGTHQIYAKASVGSNASACSTVSVQYQVTGTLAGPPHVPGASGTMAVAYQINPSHSGQMAFSGPLSFPNTPTWSVSYDNSISYPLIANGLVYFVVGGNGSGGYGTRLYAIHLADGTPAWGPVAIGGYYFRSGLTYDNGKIFVINFNGLVSSYDANTGTPGWSAVLPGQLFYTAPPTATNGTLYIGGQGALNAIDERNGNVYWSKPVSGGDDSSPTVTDDGVYVSYPCQVYKFNPVTGASAWHFAGGCSGGGGLTAAYANNSLYVRDWSASPVLYAAKGGVNLGTFPGSTIPAFDLIQGYFMSSGTLRAADYAAQNVSWSFAGDGHLVTAPIVINGTVITGSSNGTVYAVDGLTGAQVWSGIAGSSILGPDEMNETGPLAGLGAGENYLVVPAGSKLTAWKIAGP